MINAKMFLIIFTNNDGLSPSFLSCFPEGEPLGSVLFSFDKIFTALKKNMHSKCSSTPRRWPPLYSLASAIAFPLLLLYGMSMQTGLIPLIWKTALVCPVFKKSFTQIDHLSHKCVSLAKLQRV